MLDGSINPAHAANKKAAWKRELKAPISIIS
jgi:hypothetical protein